MKLTRSKRPQCGALQSSAIFVRDEQLLGLSYFHAQILDFGFLIFVLLRLHFFALCFQTQYPLHYQ